LANEGVPYPWNVPRARLRDPVARRCRVEASRIAELNERPAGARRVERGRLRVQREALWAEVRSAKPGELAAEFDSGR
jgi:hypothetical protein